jgi:hypothetical protein
MRFDPKPYLFSAALLVAGAAHAESRGPGMAPGSVAPDLTPWAAVGAAQAAIAEPPYAEGADAPSAACLPEASRAARAPAQATLGIVVMLPPDPEDPGLQRIWSGP